MIDTLVRTADIVYLYNIRSNAVSETYMTHKIGACMKASYNGIAPTDCLDCKSITPNSYRECFLKNAVKTK